MPLKGEDEYWFSIRLWFLTYTLTMVVALWDLGKVG